MRLEIAATWKLELISYILMMMQADFMKMPFPDNTFDAIFAIEATCHAPDVVCYTRIVSRP
jgi:ubiquinone/menaquinone biosynthesis C-methylase UbiE